MAPMMSSIKKIILKMLPNSQENACLFLTKVTKHFWATASVFFKPCLMNTSARGFAIPQKCRLCRFT